MAISYAVRKQLLAASLPEANEVRLELQDYLARTGMAPPDFARRINYARETLYFFLNGRYSRISSNDCSIRAAIRDFIAAHPIATPVISTGKLYETENANPDNRRERFVECTLKGMQIVTEIKTNYPEIVRWGLHPLNDAQIEQFGTLLAQIIEGGRDIPCPLVHSRKMKRKRSA